MFEIPITVTKIIIIIIMIMIIIIAKEPYFFFVFNSPLKTATTIINPFILRYYFTLSEFSYQFWLVAFHWSDSKSPQLSRTLLSILADLNKVVVWMVFILPLISNSFSPFSEPLGTDTSTPTLTGITVTFIFHSFFFFSSLARSKYLSLFWFVSLIFTPWSTGTVESTRRQFFSG